MKPLQPKFGQQRFKLLTTHHFKFIRKQEFFKEHSPHYTSDCLFNHLKNVLKNVICQIPVLLVWDRIIGTSTAVTNQNSEGQNIPQNHLTYHNDSSETILNYFKFAGALGLVFRRKWRY